jgi:hypothetical protein
MSWLAAWAGWLGCLACLASYFGWPDRLIGLAGLAALAGGCWLLHIITHTERFKDYKIHFTRSVPCKQGGRICLFIVFGWFWGLSGMSLHTVRNVLQSRGIFAWPPPACKTRFPGNSGDERFGHRPDEFRAGVWELRLWEFGNS